MKKLITTTAKWLLAMSIFSLAACSKDDLATENVNTATSNTNTKPAPETPGHAYATLRRKALISGNWRVISSVYQNLRPGAKNDNVIAADTKFNNDGSGYSTVLGGATGHIEYFRWAIINDQLLNIIFATDGSSNYKIQSLTNTQMVLQTVEQNGIPDALVFEKIR